MRTAIATVWHSEHRERGQERAASIPTTPPKCVRRGRRVASLRVPHAQYIKLALPSPSLFSLPLFEQASVRARIVMCELGAALAIWQTPETYVLTRRRATQDAHRTMEIIPILPFTAGRISLRG